MDWKLQNNREKRSISRKKQFYRIMLVGNLENLAKNRQVCLICHINVKRNQETGNRNRQTDQVILRMRRALMNAMVDGWTPPPPPPPPAGSTCYTCADIHRARQDRR